MVEKNLRNIDYIKDPKFFFEKIRKKETFALVRFGDADRLILECKRGLDKTRFLDMAFDPNNFDDILLSKALNEALTYVNDDYYIGFLRSENPPEDDKTAESFYEFYRKRINQKPSFLTCARIFLGYYGSAEMLFLKEFFKLIEEDKTLKINWICHEEVKNVKPNYINKFFFVKTNVWRLHRGKTMKEVMNYASEVSNELFLFSAGAFSKILVHKLWQDYKTNMYVDVGSAFDYFFNKSKRDRYRSFPRFIAQKIDDKYEYYNKIYQQYVRNEL